MIHLVSFYITFTVVVLCIVYAGTENTLNLVRYIELQIKIQWIEFRLRGMKRRLKRELEAAFKQFDDREDINT